VQLVNKETFLETELSGGAVICGETVKQTAMGLFIFSRSPIAITITRLLREDFGEVPRVTVSLDHRGIGKQLRV
jgi:hypothetical protein